ncbi:MAG TPA: glycoside hydrolase family 3 N-terminal domain-containing protein [Chloroflexota bacterium]
MRVNRRTFLQGSALLAASNLAGLPLDTVMASSRPPRTLQEKVGQLFVVSFPGTSPDPAFLSLLQRNRFGGVVLYGRNYSSPGQLRALLARLQEASSYPLLVCTDQEGGSVVRLRRGVHTFPSEAVYGRAGWTARVDADAATTAHDLHALGLTMNLAPVADVLSNGRSPIGDRAFGSDPRLVARLTTAAVHGYQQHGLAAAVKHFIGLGHTSIDSHQSLPTVTQTLGQLEGADLLPFRAAVAAGVSTILVAHVALPAIDPVHRPASLSPVIIGGVIRKHLGFKGVVMTDSLAMGALPQGSTADAAERALAAGADMLLISADHDIPAGVFDTAVERVIAAVRAGRISQSRLDSAVARIVALKSTYPSVLR